MEPVWSVTLTTLAPTIAVLVSALINWQSAKRAERQTKRVAEVLEETTATTGMQLANLTEVADKTHQIVNSQNTLLLKNYALATARIAEENPKDGKAQDMAREAKLALNEKEKK